MLGTAVRQIITRHGRDDDVLELHALGGFGNTIRLVNLKSQRFGGFHGAETAGSRAILPRNHECGGAFAPTLPVVRALSAFAHSVQLQITQQLPRLKKTLGGGQFSAQPLR